MSLSARDASRLRQQLARLADVQAPLANGQKRGVLRNVRVVQPEASGLADILDVFLPSRRTTLVVGAVAGFCAAWWVRSRAGWIGQGKLL